MGNVGFENLKELALALRDAYSLATFIETGTYKAATTEWAADNFERVVSIELDEGYHNRAKKVLGKRKGLKLVLGDSGVELAKVLKRLKQPVLIWLDAHWCKAKVSAGSECPLREELAAIRESGVEHFILIDDARLFENPPNGDWPSMDEIRRLLPEGYRFKVWNDAIIATSPNTPVQSKELGGVWEIAGADHQKDILFDNVYKRPESIRGKYKATKTSSDDFAARKQEEINLESKLEPVILTSNKYLHCLPPFAYLFNKFWPGQSVKVVRYEVRPPKLPPNFTNYAIGKQDDYTWSSGLLKYLDDHQGELILLMLEDYFINGAVRVNDIKAAWDRMLIATGVDKVDLTDDRLKVPHRPVSEIGSFSGFDAIKSADDAPFQASLQAAIWRVDFLRKILDPTENPWQFEKNGTRRIIQMREAGEFNGLILGFKNPPLTYVNAKGGMGTLPGLWDMKKIPPWMEQELSRKGLM